MAKNQTTPTASKSDVAPPAPASETSTVGQSSVAQSGSEAAASPASTTPPAATPPPVVPPAPVEEKKAPPDERVVIARCVIAALLLSGHAEKLLDRKEVYTANSKQALALADALLAEAGMPVNF